MFVLFQKKSNYSAALNICSSIGGNLAHVASITRSLELSKLLRNSTTIENIAYIGLNEPERNKFTTSDYEPLKCFTFRGWAPGHPPDLRRPGCVALTSHSAWKVFNCDRKLMFLCEVYSSGPNNNVNNLNRFIPIETTQIELF